MSQAMLDVCTAELRRRYVNHEISADEFASLAEDIQLASRRNSR